MTLVQMNELISLFAGIRLLNLALSVVLLVMILARLNLWLSNPPTHIKMLGLAALLLPVTIIGHAIDQFLRAVTPGAAVFGTVMVLFTLGAALVLAPEADGRPAPLLRWMEHLGDRHRSRKTRR